MSIHLKIPSNLGRLADGVREVEIEASRIGEALHKLCVQFPKTRPAIFSSTGQLNRNVQVFVNNEMIQFLDNLETPVTAKDEITLIAGLSGG